jgi:hypothetical protein
MYLPSVLLFFFRNGDNPELEAQKCVFYNPCTRACLGHPYTEKQLTTDVANCANGLLISMVSETLKNTIREALRGRHAGFAGFFGHPTSRPIVLPPYVDDMCFSTMGSHNLVRQASGQITTGPCRWGSLDAPWPYNHM